MDRAEILGLARSLAIYHGRPWRHRALVRFYRSLLGPGRLAFDIGAHVGGRSRALRAAGARVVALEPNPTLHRFLRLLFRDSGTTLLNCAAGSVCGELELSVSRRHPAVSSLSGNWIGRMQGAAGFDHVRWDRRVSVPVTTLDALIVGHGRPDFVKLDVEGMEAEILLGLSCPLPLIALEYLPQAPDLAIACIDRLEALGPCRFNRVEGEGAAFAHADWCSGQTMRDVLHRLPPGARHGDLYARQVPA